MELHKDATVRISLGLIAALLVWVSGATWKAYGYVTTIAANTMAIQQVATSLELGRVNDEIGDLRKERRDLKRKYGRDPDNELLSEQLDEIADEIEELEHQRDCIEDPTRRVCE